MQAPEHEASANDEATVEPVQAKTAESEKPQQQDITDKQEQVTLDDWKQEEKERREKSKQNEQRNEVERTKAVQRKLEAGSTTFKFPHVPDFKDRPTK